MTYKELLEQLQQLPEERLNDTVTVFDPYTSEYTAIVQAWQAEKDWDDGEMEPDHLYLIMKA